MRERLRQTQHTNTTKQASKTTQNTKTRIQTTNKHIQGRGHRTNNNKEAIRKITNRQTYSNNQTNQTNKNKQTNQANKQQVMGQEEGFGIEEHIRQCSHQAHLRKAVKSIR